MMREQNQPVIVVISASGLKTARRIAQITGGELHGYAKRVAGCAQSYENVGEHLQKLFKTGRTIIAVMASGAVIRCLAPVLANKREEPPVLVVSEDGASIVPLIGGHHGANQIARFLANEMEAHAAITTAGDLQFGIALDEPPEGYVLANPDAAKPVMAELLKGEFAVLCGTAPWLTASDISFSENGRVRLSVTDEVRQPENLELVYNSKTLVLGVGCERGTNSGEVVELAESVLAEANLASQSLAAVVSIDLKADEPALHDVAGHFGVPVRFFNAARLALETPRLANPSDIVFKETGCHGVAEGASLAAVGDEGTLVVPKRKSARATVAIARSPRPVDPLECGVARGHLSVVGIGPGGAYWRSPEVSSLIEEASDLVGYSLYLDLLEGIATAKTRHEFALGQEEDRVRHAMELAGNGRNVALVCSGDAGIYAMATLVFELLERGDLSPPAKRISIQVSPGISAFQAAAARTGAPLGHDFCTISLSDLLTPWDMIKRRIEAAARGDFVIAFYNPASKRRRSQLSYAKEQLLKHRPVDTPVVFASNLGRNGESVRIVPLEALDIDEVDMLTVVIVGSSESRVVRTGDRRDWVFTPRGYAAKDRTKTGSGALAE